MKKKDIILTIREPIISPIQLFFSFISMPLLIILGWEILGYMMAGFNVYAILDIWNYADNKSEDKT